MIGFHASDADTRRISRRWTAAWLGGPVIGIANGTVRELVYRRRVGELRAHQISTATGLALFVPFMVAVQRRWPLRSRRQAAEIGAVWVALTMAFEFGFGHWVGKASWPELLENYDVAAGRVWVAILLWLGFGPVILYELDRMREQQRSTQPAP